VILVGLTGGIGSGKSTVSALLAERGAVILDADAVARELQRAGQPVLAAVIERFGDEMLTEDGELDRPHLAALVFADPAALADLNALVHPAVGVELVRRIEAARGTDAVVVLDSPLLAAHPRDGMAATIVVDVPIETAVERLVHQRGMTEADAQSRIARQIGREERLATADRVIDNSGDRAALEAQVDELWAWLHTLPHT
jgi:dephospho-CoA kinase